jgi:hypothetical protein
VKAQSFMQQSKDTPEFKTVALARADLEKRPPAESAALRRNSDAALQEALALTLP